MTLAEAGETGPIWVVADRQLNGRGRGGRRWESEPGNLLATFAFETRADVAEAVQLSFLAGLAVGETVSDFLGPQTGRIALKWPNDVLVDGAKIAGVLVETTRIRPSGPLVALIGIGINVARAPDGLDQPATSLKGVLEDGTRTDMGGDRIAPSRDAVLVRLDRALCEWLARWADGAGWTEVREAWMRRNGLVGRRVRVEMGGAPRHGVMKGLGATGSLLVETDDGVLLEVGHGEVQLEPQRAGEGGSCAEQARALRKP